MAIFLDAQVADCEQVNDWQTRCSTSAVDELAMLRLVKLLPTAGCDPEEPASEDSWSCEVKGRKFGDGVCLDDGAYLCGTRLSEGAPAIFVAALPISGSNLTATSAPAGRQLWHQF